MTQRLLIMKLPPACKTTYKWMKPYLRWFILALTLGFILHTLRLNWQQVLTLRLTPYAIAELMLALGITLSAHIWSGWVWYGIMRSLNAPVPKTWTMITYLKTNLGKYLPGNIWHFVGRIQFLREYGTSTGVAITGVVLEPLLMSVAALAIVLVSLPSTLIQFGILVAVLIALHPRILNPILKRLAQAKLKQADQVEETHLQESAKIPKLRHYPWQTLLGEVGFVVFRGVGFMLCFMALYSLDLADVWILVGAFSFGWLLGLVVPGAPGGLGVFEATVLAVLTPKFPAAIVLGAVALYRLNSTLAELLGAGLAVLDERWNAAIANQANAPVISEEDEPLPQLPAGEP
ncbi:MAG: YbhN family protein [Cyanobacteria bacterium P01_F01_bin.56]